MGVLFRFLPALPAATISSVDPVVEAAPIASGDEESVHADASESAVASRPAGEKGVQGRMVLFVGVNGPSGVGRSTLIAELVSHFKLPVLEV